MQTRRVHTAEDDYGVDATTYLIAKDEDQEYDMEQEQEEKREEGVGAENNWFQDAEVEEKWLGAPIGEATTILLPGKGDQDTAQLDDCDHGCCDDDLVQIFYENITFL